MPLQECPDRNQLKSLQTGALEEDRAVQLGKHLDECGDCRQAIETIATEGETLESALMRIAPKNEFENELGMKLARRLVERLPEMPAATSKQLQSIGPYVLERQLGEGGMGAVYEAVHSGLDKTVAAKIFTTS